MPKCSICGRNRKAEDFKKSLQFSSAALRNAPNGAVKVTIETELDMCATCLSQIGSVATQFEYVSWVNGWEKESADGKN